MIERYTFEDRILNKTEEVEKPYFVFCQLQTKLNTFKCSINLLYY